MVGNFDARRAQRSPGLLRWSAIALVLLLVSVVGLRTSTPAKAVDFYNNISGFPFAGGGAGPQTVSFVSGASGNAGAISVYAACASGIGCSGSSALAPASVSIGIIVGSRPGAGARGGGASLPWGGEGRS